jgi:hypothetical protein
VDAETAAMPLAAASRASSGQLQRASGFPLAAGGSQARALTSAATRAANFRGRPRGVGQPVHALLAVAAPPLAGRVLADAEPGGDRAVGEAVRGQQHDPRPQHQPERRRAAPGNRLQLRPAGIIQADHMGAGRHGHLPR